MYIYIYMYVLMYVCFRYHQHSPPMTESPSEPNRRTKEDYAIWSPNKKTRPLPLQTASQAMSAANPDRPDARSKEELTSEKRS